MSVFFVVLQENLHRVSLNLIRNDNALTDDKSYDMLKQRRCMIETMKRFADACSETAVVEKPAKLEGRNMLMFLAPKTNK